MPDNNARAGLLANGAGATKPVTLGPGVANLLKLWPVQNGPELLNSNGFATGIGLAFSNPTQHIREDFGTARFDANLSANDLLFAVVTIDDSTAQTPTQNPLSRIDEALREQVWSVQEQHVFSPRLLNTARLGFSRAGFLFQGDVPADVSAASGTFVPGKPVGAVVVAGSTASNGSSQLTGAGSNVGSNNTMARNLFTVDDHLFITFGRHQLDAGGWVQRLQSNDNLAQNQFGQASFASLATLLSGTIKTFTVVPTPTPLNWRSWFGASYIQDTWKPTSHLELTGGLRTESTNGFNEAHGRAGIYNFTGGVIQTNPAVGTAALPHNRAKFLLEPRAGFAWDLSGHGTTSLRGAVGLHHSLLDNLDYRLDQAAPYNTTLTYSGVPVAAPTSGAAGLISPSTVQTDLWTPTVLAWDLKIEQQIAPATSFTLAYIGSHATHQILSSDLNEPAFVVCENTCPAGVPNGTAYYPNVTKQNTAVANTTSWTSGGTANYNGLVVDVRHSLSHGLQLRGNYTFSKNLDNGSAWNTSVSSNTPAYVSVPSLSRLDYGRAATDVRQLAAINGSYNLPFGHEHGLLSDGGLLLSRAVSGWTLSSILTLQTGLPFSPQLGYNPTGSGDTRNPVRPNINPAFHGSVYTGGSTAQRAARYFNPAAFSAPVGGAVGNLGRDTLTGPGFADWDLSLLKDTQLTERTRLQFRTETFNLLNHTNLLTPNPVVFTSGPTQGTAASRTAAAVESPTAGVVTAAATSRQIQFGLKLLF